MSLDWAKENNAEIISCDSLLFYEHMNIGTAKPSDEELREVSHHLVNVVPPSRQYSISEYLAAVKLAVSDIHSRGNKVLIVGGSGFYLNAFFAPVMDGLKLNASEETRITRIFDGQSLATSVEELLKLNPNGLGELDVKNPRRVLKAWLRCVAAGKSLIEIQADFQEQAGAFDRFDRRLVVLSRPREVLEERVQLRVDQMITEGLVDEVRKLLDLNILENPSAAGSIGYRETIACIEGKLPGSELAQSIAQNTRKLLKKQRTWFKKFLPLEAVVDISALERLPDEWHLIPSISR